MPQPNRSEVVLPDFPHHVTVRGNNRRNLFSQAPDYDYFVYLVGNALSQHPVLLHGLTLMSNHVHFIVCPPDANTLAKFMARVCQRYAQFRNAKRQSSGKLFEAPYFAKPILTEAQLACTLAYVDLNPVRAGRVEHPWEYRYSTYGCHVGVEPCAIPRALWTPSPWYLDLGATELERAVRYSEWVADCRLRNTRPDDLSVIDAREALAKFLSSKTERRPNGKRAA